MKFGITLDQHSVPEWRPYNLDYRDIKTVIKRQTIAHAPVETPDLSPDYENELFDILAEQLDRINLFVKSKTGEIKSRLVSFRRQLVALKKRSSVRTAGKTATSYAKLELELERAGNDVQRLSRYVVLQHTGFRKLLKKYRKWSGSDCLLQRFGILLDSPSAFHHQNFEQLVMEVSELLSFVRDGVDALAHSDGASSPATQMATVSQPDRSLQRLSTSSSSKSSSGLQEPNRDSDRAVFWVHNDHLIELQFLLLKHLTIQSSSPTSTRAATPTLSRMGSSHGVASGKEDETVIVTLDDIDYAQLSTNDAGLLKVASALISWKTQSPEAKISTSRHSNAASELVIKKKYAECIVHPHLHEVNISCKDSTTERAVQNMQDWFLHHPEVKPLAKIWFRRTRFSGKTPRGHVWAHLDRDIKTRALNGASGWAADELPSARDYVTFPHAICEIRWDGELVPSVVDALKHSHLAREVDGFLLETHATITACRGAIASPWNVLLRQDIRLAPPLDYRNSRRSSNTTVYGFSSKNSSATGGTVDSFVHESSVASDGAHACMEARANRNKKRPRRKKRTLSKIKNISGERYWNELEGDGSDHGDPEPYMIVVNGKGDDNDDEDLALSDFVMRPIHRAWGAIKSSLAFRKTGANTNENTDLLGNGPYHAYVDSSSDEEDRRPVRIPEYGTYGTPTQRRNRRVGKHILFLFTSCLALIFGGVIAIQGALNRKKHEPHEEPGNLLVDFGVITFLLTSIGFAVLGLSMFLTGSRSGAWTHPCIVWVSFIAIMIGDGVVAGLLFRTEMGN